MVWLIAWRAAAEGVVVLPVCVATRVMGTVCLACSSHVQRSPDVIVRLIAWHGAAEAGVVPPVKISNACHENRVSVGAHTSARLVQQIAFQTCHVYRQHHGVTIVSMTPPRRGERVRRSRMHPLFRFSPW